MPQKGYHSRQIARPSLSECILMFWVFTFTLDEILQFNSEVKDKFKSKILKYLDNNWNYLDIFGCVLFIVAMCLRFVAMVTDENVFIAARIVLAIDLALWFTRLLHHTIIFKSLGPKLVMINQMVEYYFIYSFLSIKISKFKNSF